MSRFDDMRAPYDRPGGESLNHANGAGRTQLIAQTYDAALGRYEFSGNQGIDAVLIGSRWTATTLTYSFPTSGSFYSGQGYPAGTEPAGHVTFNAAQQAAVTYSLGLISAYTNLNFTQVTETASTHANLRFSQTNYSEVGSAYANFPSSSSQAGDVWFGRTGEPFYLTPAKGNWGLVTMMHEIGHAVGLKHGHDDYTNDDLAGEGYLDEPAGGGARPGSVALPADQDGQAWSIMTYRSDPTGSPDTFEGEGFNQAQTFMQYDIAALQYLYGADFTTNSGNTTYTWSATTGQMAINGVGQGAPTSNKILMTVWDGNGIDTYNLSNYTVGLNLDLTPGGFSTFDPAQLVDHQAVSPGTAIAIGNVANALLYNGDLRSLIENAIGGSGNDRIRGNQANNTLTGNNGNDVLIGDIGSDKLFGGAGNDQLFGDGSGLPTGVGMGDGQVIKASGAGNNTLATAMNVTNEFSLASDADILNSTSSPHVSIQATADGNIDYYRVTVLAGTQLTFDVDYTSSGLDSYIILYNSAGTQLSSNDDSVTDQGGGGSTRTYDSFLQYTATVSGTYIIAVADYPGSDPIVAGNTYELQISVSNGAGVGSGNGNDTLNGGIGADTMVGGAGNDIYYVDNVGDIVRETAGQGTDTVATSISYTLAASSVVEIFRTTDSAGTGALNLTGNALNQTITGNAGANIIRGGGGTDTMQGIGGNDTYFVDSASDIVVEGANQGSDTVVTSVSYGLSAAAQVETLRTTSNAGTTNLSLSGNNFAQKIIGNNGNNVFVGKGGNDVLTGLGGDDIFRFNGAFATDNVDVITDFVAADDTIQLENAIFTALTATGTLAASLFKDIAVAAKDANDRIIYNSANGALYYDADGSGSAFGNVKFAVLTGAPTLTAADFVVI